MPHNISILQILQNLQPRMNIIWNVLLVVGMWYVQYTDLKNSSWDYTNKNVQLLKKRGRHRRTFGFFTTYFGTSPSVENNPLRLCTTYASVLLLEIDGETREPRLHPCETNGRNKRIVSSVYIHGSNKSHPKTSEEEGNVKTFSHLFRICFCNLYIQVDKSPLVET